MGVSAGSTSQRHKLLRENLFVCPVLEPSPIFSPWLQSSSQSTKGVKADKAASEEDTECPDPQKDIARSIKGQRDHKSAADGKAGTLGTSTAGPKVSSPDLTDASAWK